MRFFLPSALGVSLLLLAGAAQASPQADAPPPASGAPSVSPTTEPPPAPPAVPVPAPPPAPAPPAQATAAPPVAPPPPSAPPAPPTAQETPPANEAAAPEKAAPSPLPYAMRGGIEVGVSALKFGRASQLVPTAMLLAAHLPVAEGTFVDLRLPFAVATLGNPQIGAHHARAVADGVWLSVGGSLGLPLVTDGPVSPPVGPGLTCIMHDFWAANPGGAGPAVRRDVARRELC